MPTKPAPCREGLAGAEGLKSHVLGPGLLPPGNAEEIPTPAAPVCLPVPLGCLPWDSFVMKLPQELLAHIQDDLQGL